MSTFRPTADERDMLKQAVAKFGHEPSRSHLLSRLELADAEYDHGSDDWNRLKLCIEHHYLHAQTEVQRNPNKKPPKLLLAKADALARRFHPNFS